jgi:hypothetical protein
MEPPRQIDQSPADNSMDRRYRAAFNDLYKGQALGIIQQGGLARCLALEEPIRTSPRSLNRTTQSRTICNVTPVIRAASLWLPLL